MLFLTLRLPCLLGHDLGDCTTVTTSFDKKLLELNSGSLSWEDCVNVAGGSYDGRVAGLFFGQL
jgi:hypothetical protein